MPCHRLSLWSIHRQLDKFFSTAAREKNFKIVLPFRFDKFVVLIDSDGIDSLNRYALLLEKVNKLASRARFPC